MSSEAGRLIVVLGYSDREDTGLHPICASRLTHAASLSTNDDVVVLSGWARTPGVQPEAELMAAAWTGNCRELVVDPVARHTVENATNAVDDVLRSRAETVVVVTSRWHAPRARLIFAWVFRGLGTQVVGESPDEDMDRQSWLREIPRWIVLPLQLVTVRRTAR